MYKTIGDDISYEVFDNVIVIYLKKVDNQFVKSNKCFGTHILEQILADDGTIINESIKENPHHIDSSKGVYSKSML